MTRPTVIVACADLMITSRFQTSGADVDLIATRTPDAALAAVASNLGRARDTRAEKSVELIVVVDLATCGELPGRLRDQYGDELVVLGFAPHVQVELIEAARPFCTRVLPRGSVIKQFADVITESLAPGI